MSTDRSRALPLSTACALAGCFLFIILNGFSLKALSERQRDRETTLQLQKQVEQLRVELEAVRKLADAERKPRQPIPVE